eukprot:s374_g44.t1
MVVGAEVKALGNSYYGLGQTAPLSKEAQIKLVTLSLVVTVSLSFTATLWSLQTGRLSKKVGLDWEVYLFLFCCGGLSLLIQSVVAVAWLKAGDRFDATAFAVASMSILPFLSDQFDTLKDIIFGALCFQSEHWAIKILGFLSWLYLLAFHAWFVFCGVAVGLWGRNPEGAPGANCFSELATSHLAVLLTAAKVDGESSAGFWEETILPTLYKQLTPSKRDYLLIENLPQAVLSLLFLFFEGGSMFIVVLNLAVPAVQVGLTFLLFKPVRAAAAPALGKALSRAVASGNTIRAKNVWQEAEVGEDIQLFQRMLPRLRFVLDELDKLSEGELRALHGFARMLTLGEARCNLFDKKIGDAGAKVVAQALKHTATEELQLSGNEIGDDGAQALGDGLKENKSLVLLLLENNSIGDAGAQALGEGLKENRSLEKLDLNSNSSGDAGAQALGESLKENRSLLELCLDNNRIGYAGAQALGEGLKENRSLEKLFLNSNSIGDAGAQAPGCGGFRAVESRGGVGVAGPRWSCGQEGVISQGFEGEVCEKMVKALGDGLKSNGTLETLFLNSNSIGKAGAQALAAAIIENRSLKELYLDRSLRDTPGGQALLEAQKVKEARGESGETEKIGSDLRAIEACLKSR